MHVLGIVFFLASLYYFGWFLVGGQTGSIVGSVNLLSIGYLFLSLSKKSQKIWFGQKPFFLTLAKPINTWGYGTYAIFIFAIFVTAYSMLSASRSISDAVIGLIPTVGLLLATLCVVCYFFRKENDSKWQEK